MIEALSWKTERLPVARGILTPQPEFTWALTTTHDGDCQTACEVEVDHLPPGGNPTPVWRSGKMIRLIGDEV